MITVIVLLVALLVCIFIIQKYRHICEELTQELRETRRLLKFSQQRNRDLCAYFYSVKEDTTNDAKRNS